MRPVIGRRNGTGGIGGKAEAAVIGGVAEDEHEVFLRCRKSAQCLFDECSADTPPPMRGQYCERRQR